MKYVKKERSKSKNETNRRQKIKTLKKSTPTLLAWLLLLSIPPVTWATSTLVEDLVEGDGRRALLFESPPPLARALTTRDRERPCQQRMPQAYFSRRRFWPPSSPAMRVLATIHLELGSSIFLRHKTNPSLVICSRMSIKPLLPVNCKLATEKR